MKLPIKLAENVYSFASIIDQTAADQALSLAKLEHINPHLALMPDVHAGLGSAVGTVIPTVGIVIPAAVGVDIGCGMIAAKTSFTTADLAGRNLSELRDALEHAIPMSAGNYNKNLDRFEFTRARIEHLERLAAGRAAAEQSAAKVSSKKGQPAKNRIDLSHSPNWPHQLGSLGGGNHFIELCADENDDLWMFLHSGSRGVGNKIAKKHITAAKNYCAAEKIHLEHQDHAYLREGTPEFDAYLRELEWAQLFALLNREEMMDRFAKVLATFMGVKQIVELERINAHHNYTEKVSINDLQVYLTRKGAINAARGVMGLIPGSMGDKSFVVEGLGNEKALWSAPHGAGRALSRTQARRQYTVKDLEDSMRGIVYKKGKAWIDEIPAAYKPISQVMQDAADLVRVRHTLRQLVNVKGL